MPNWVPTDRILLLLVLLSLLVPCVSVHGGGSPEKRIRDAEALIEESRYDEAIFLLTRVIEDDPDRLDEAERLLSRIRSVRAEFNSRYQELIRVLYEERDVEHAMTLIRELETLDRNPNRAVAASLATARETAAFIYNLNLFNDIMQRAGIELAKGNRWEAVEIYREGFVLHREDFDRADYAEEVRTEVLAAVEAMNAALDRFAALRPVHEETVRRAEDVLTVAAGRDMRSVDRLYREYREILLSILAASEDIGRAAVTLKRRNEEIRRNSPGDREDFFMSYLSRIADGRPGSSTPEGMIHAIDTVVHTTVADLGERLMREAETAQDKGERALAAKRWAEAEAAFGEARSLRITAVDTIGLVAAGFHPTDALVLPDREREAADVLLSPILAAVSGAKSARISAELVEAVRLLDGSGSSADTHEALDAARRRLQKELKTAATASSDLQKFVRVLRSAADGYDTGEALRIASGTLGSTVRYGKRLAERDGDTAVASADLSLAELRERTTDLETRAAQARGFLEGIEEPAGDDPAQMISARYPDRTVPMAERSLPLIEALRRDAGVLLDGFLSDRDYVLDRKDFRERIEAVRSLGEEIEALIAEARRLIDSGEEQIFQASRARQEGDLRYREAGEALSRSAYQEARDRIAQARDAYLRSLSLQEDPALRRESDRRLLALADRIQDAENRIIITEVRRLINEGRRFYLQEEYERAETVLVRAQNRWRTTNPEENPEVTYWLGFVRAALFVESSREIAETNPLYTEMIQLLNLARDDYERGRQLLDRRDRQSALQAFESAEQKILRVKIPFPYNKEASVLSLLIMRHRDSRNFNQLFGQRLREARANIGKNPQDAYIELRDLAEINPGFPGLQEAIVQAELALGIRKPQITRAQIDESDRFYRQALQIVQGNIRAQFPIALEQLNRAIEINPENERAVQLKDRILLDAGGRSTVVLSAASEQQYRLAEEKYIQGNIFEALAIVERLMRDDANRRYGPLRELQDRINSRLGRNG